jgi:hypothetical protein
LIIETKKITSFKRIMDKPNPKNMIQQRVDEQLKAAAKKNAKSPAVNSYNSKNKSSQRSKNVEKSTPDKSNKTSSYAQNDKSKSSSKDKSSTKKTSYDDQNHHYNDSDGEASWNSGKNSFQDDENTVNSDKTSKISKKDLSKIILPKFTRYQMMILLDQENNEKAISENTEEDKSPTQRVMEVLASFVVQVKTADPDAKIMTWKTSPNFSYMNDEFPTDVAEVALHFSGFRANIKADKRVYLRVAIHTPNSESKLFANLSEWMRIYGYNINKCIQFQEENF